MNNNLQVFKFGGASIKTPALMRNVGNIIVQYKETSPLVVVVSAIDKTTNELEEVTHAKFYMNEDKAFALLDKIKQKHFNYIEELLEGGDNELSQQVHEHFVEAEWVIEENREMPYDYAYDQIVSIGELVSSCILVFWLQKIGLPVEWVDARSLIKTDDTYRDGRVQWKETIENIDFFLKPLLNKKSIVVTQGFIGSTFENNTTTLGREGSDYTAAILSRALAAESMTIWKDVPGVLTADPDLYHNVTKLDRLSYAEAIEMTYYGCKVIHPKTIQPLKLLGIPLYVKSFIEPEGEGTLISGDVDPEYPPIVVLEKDQALIHFSSKDLSFIAEHHLAHLFDLFGRFRIKVNMMRNTAISFTVCVKNDTQRIAMLIEEVAQNFKVLVDADLELITVRHYNDHMLPKLLEDKIVLLEERIRKTVQLVVKNAPPIIPIKRN